MSELNEILGTGKKVEKRKLDLFKSKMIIAKNVFKYYLKLFLAKKKGDLNYLIMIIMSNNLNLTFKYLISLYKKICVIYITYQLTIYIF